VNHRSYEVRACRASLADDQGTLVQRRAGRLEPLPTILRSGPYRMFFYSADQHEPPHVHVERDDSEAKFWLNPVRLESSRGFRRSEIKQIEDVIVDKETLLLEAWNEYFGN
jgi:uncharacterized protein DUF4160